MSSLAFGIATERMAGDYWLLSRPKPRSPDAIVTRAFVMCCGCEKALSAHGGPALALCEDCLNRVTGGALRDADSRGA